MPNQVRRKVVLTTLALGAVAGCSGKTRSDSDPSAARGGSGAGGAAPSGGGTSSAGAGRSQGVGGAAGTGTTGNAGTNPGDPKGGTTGAGDAGDGGTSTGNQSGSGGHVIGDAGDGGSISIGVGGTGSACTGVTATLASGDAPTLLFLVDTSLSMADAVPGQNQSKMAATRDALEETFTVLPNDTKVGLIFFPHVPIMAMPCFDPNVEVPIAPLDTAQRAALTNAMAAVSPDGATPTHDAYAFALESLQALAEPGPQSIILVTDGEPTYELGCMGTGVSQQPPISFQPLIDASAGAYAADGIRTFVIGSPGSEGARAGLSAMARVGATGTSDCDDSGVPRYCHFDLTSSDASLAADLSSTFANIDAQIPRNCAFGLPQPPDGMKLDLSKLNVVVTHDDQSKTVLTRSSDGNCSTGQWRYTGSPPDGLELCPAACDALRGESRPEVDVQLGCSTLLP